MRDKAKDPEQNLVRQGLNWAHLEKDKSQQENLYIKSIFFLTRKNLYRTHWKTAQKQKYFPKTSWWPIAAGNEISLFCFPTNPLESETFYF